MHDALIFYDLQSKLCAREWEREYYIFDARPPARLQKKSREESHGEGSGVEIIVNEPYENGPGGNGQYTKKIYHVGSHLPGKLYCDNIMSLYYKLKSP